MKTFDAIILGGGAAGLSAATALGRFRRSVAVIDAGSPRNAPADGVHNFLTRDGVNPLEFQRLGRAEASSYGVSFFDGAARDIQPGFSVTVGDHVLTAQRLIVATGTVDELPAIPGLAERWGRDVIHCPYCHGWEVRDRAIGVLGTHARAAHVALMFRQLSDRVTVFLDPSLVLPPDELAQLTARGVTLVTGTISRLHTVDDALSTVTLDDGSTHPVEALAVGSFMRARVDALAPLGLVAVDHPSGAGTHLAVDGFGLTALPNVWAAGNVSDPMAQVVTSAAQGLAVAAAVNADLIAEEARAAVAAAPTTTAR